MLKNLFYTILLLFQGMNLFGQTKECGTIIITPRSAYFAKGEFVKKDSISIVSILKKDTLLSLPFGGYMIIPLEHQSDSLSAFYNFVKEDSNILDPVKIYYKCVYILFDNNSQIYYDTAILNHIIYISGEKIIIRNRFTDKARDFDTIDCSRCSP